MRGFNVRRAPDNYVVVTLPHSADPEKDNPEWLADRAAEQPDDVAFRREILIDWSSAEGNPFFPEFAQNAREYVSWSDVDPLKPIIRGWDFGRRKPAVVWLQEQNNQVVVLASIIGDDIDIHSFRDLVMFLSADPMRTDLAETTMEDELEVLKTRPAALKYLRQIIETKPWWPEGDPDKKDYRVPFFNPGHTFLDHSSHESYQQQAFETEKGERSSAEVLAARGISINWLQKPESYADNIIRRLMLRMPDGRFGLSVRPMATHVIIGLSGALVYKKPTQQSPRPNKIRDDGLFINAYDALKYGVINLADIGERVGTYRREVGERSVEYLRGEGQTKEELDSPRKMPWTIGFKDDWLD